MTDTELLTEMLGAVRELAERVERIEATVRENCNAAEILAKRRERLSAAQARWRAGQKQNVDSTIHVDSTKEKEAEIRDIPPTPPIENKGEEKEISLASIARACEEDDPGECMVINRAPSLEYLLTYIQGKDITEEEARRWYDYMSKELCWIDPKTGKMAKHWPSWLFNFVRKLRRDKKHEEQHDREHERKMAYYTPRQQTANNQPKGVVLKREGEEHHARW